MSKTLRRDIIAEDSAESAKWNGKIYSYWNEDTKALPFFYMNDGSAILGSFEGNQTHETAMLLYSYKLLSKEPPLDDNGQLSYRKMYDEIEVGRSKLFNRLNDNVKWQGRVFETDDENYVFSCYELLNDDDAKVMMSKIALRLGLPREKCYYIGHYNQKTIPLISKISENKRSIIISESQYKRLFQINENVAVWKWIEEIKNVSSEIYKTLKKNFLQLQRYDDSFSETYEIAGVKINVYYERINNRNYHGQSYEKSNTIAIYVDTTSTEKEIEDIISHELTHQNNKNYNKSKLGHYFGQNTFTWKGRQSKALDNINAILYNLWSNDEMSAYQTRAVHADFDVLTNRYNRLKNLIDGLVRKQPNENDIYYAVRSYLSKQRKDTKLERLPSLENFKNWFIDNSYKRLERYWRRLKKNWYKYHTEISPDLATSTLSKKNDKIIHQFNSIDKIKETIKNNINDIAESFTQQFCSEIKNYWQSYSDLSVYAGDYKIAIDTFINYKQVKEKVGWGTRTYQKSVFTHRGRKAQIVMMSDSIVVIFTPTKYLEDVMVYNRSQNKNSFEYDENMIAKEIKKLILKQLKDIEISKP